MSRLSTTVSKNGDIIKITPGLSENVLKDRGIYEVEHQRDIFKKGKLKDFPYNRNLIMGPHNRTGGFKQMAEKFIEKNPNSPKIANILKEAENLKITLQPNVPEGTFKTKSLGYRQLSHPVGRFVEVAKSTMPELVDEKIGLAGYTKNLEMAKKSLGVKKTLEGVGKKTLKKSALKGAAKALRSIPGLGLAATVGFGAYGLYDAIKKGYTDPSELLASAAWGSGVEFKDKEEKKKEGIASLKV